VLSAALADHPEVFDEIFIGLIKAGEKTGQLAQVFGHLGNHLKWVDEIRRKIKKATSYPIFLFFMMMGIASLMMLYVVPRLSSFLTSQGFDLPLYTKALIVTSNAFQNYWYLIIGIPICIFMSIKIAYKFSADFAFFWDKVKLKIPVIGMLIKKIEMARFCRFFSITFVSGISIIECLEIAANVVQNKVIKKAIDDARKQVSEGEALTKALANTGQFPRLVLRMVKIGENSGNLGSALDNVNDFFNVEVNDSVNVLVGMMQPLLTILMGGMMLWISISVFGPLYGSFSKMKF
jgi:type IV pilus assembly protein PilC